jgi:hypothetical protein
MAKRVMISGAIASHPLYGAGNSWAFLQYVLGFRKLGFEVYYLEQLNADDCIADDWRPADFSSSANVQFFRTLLNRFDLTGHGALLECEGPGYVGLSRTEIETIAPDMELLLNLSGRLHLNSGF